MKFLFNAAQVFLLFNLSIFANTLTPETKDPFNKEFVSTLKTNGYSNTSSHTYCINKDNENQGYDLKTSKRIASLTKLYTTILALKKMDLHQTFKTKFYYNNKNLHIDGDSDPWFEEDKLFYLIKSLNDLGITQIDTVTFTKDFFAAAKGLGEYEELNVKLVEDTLKEVLNTAKWNSTTKWYYTKVKDFAKKEGYEIELPAKLNLKVSYVGYSEINPLLQFKDTKVFTHESRPLHEIIKSMNVMSKNWVSEMLYNKIEDPNYELTYLGLKDESVSIRNGSGLPINDANGRHDNQASCEMLLKLLKDLKSEIEFNNFKMTEIMATGMDNGTFEKRLKNTNQQYVKQNMLAKTGTIKHASTLGGFIQTDASSYTPFIIINHTYNISAGRKFQDEFLTKMHNGLKKKDDLKIDYTKKSIFPLTKAFFN